MTGRLPWHVGRETRRTIYDANDQLIGVMDTPGLAHHVVMSVNTAPRVTAGSTSQVRESGGPS